MRASWTALLTAALLWAGCASESSEPPGRPAQAPPDTAGSAPAAASAVKANPPTVTDRGRSVEARLADATLAARVKERLVEVQNLAPSDFDLKVTNGRVTLEGDVPSRAQWEETLAAAREVEDVEHVTNRLTVAGERVATAREEEEPSQEETMAQARPAEPKAQRGGSASQKSQDAGQRSVHHRVEPGETLWAIAEEQGTSVQRLKQLNGLSSGNIQPGDRLLIRKGSASSGGTTAAAAPSAGEAASGSAAPQESAPEASSTEYYVVKRGETLWAIANKNGTTVAQLKSLNDLSSSRLMPGDRLRVN